MIKSYLTLIHEPNKFLIFEKIMCKLNMKKNQPTMFLAHTVHPSPHQLWVLDVCFCSPGYTLLDYFWVFTLFSWIHFIRLLLGIYTRRRKDTLDAFCIQFNFRTLRDNGEIQPDIVHLAYYITFLFTETSSVPHIAILFC